MALTESKRVPHSIAFNLPNYTINSALRSKVRLHATGGAFSGKGQTLGSSDTPSVTTGNTGGGFFNIDPQMQLFLGLVGGYLALTYFFS